MSAMRMGMTFRLLETVNIVWGYRRKSGAFLMCPAPPFASYSQIPINLDVSKERVCTHFLFIESAEDNAKIRYCDNKKLGSSTFCRFGTQYVYLSIRHSALLRLFLFGGGVRLQPVFANVHNKFLLIL